MDIADVFLAKIDFDSDDSILIQVSSSGSGVERVCLMSVDVKNDLHFLVTLHCGQSIQMPLGLSCNQVGRTAFQVHRRLSSMFPDSVAFWMIK